MKYVAAVISWNIPTTNYCIREWHHKGRKKNGQREANELCSVGIVKYT